jgi:molybdate transport system substrate-binding protein
MNMKVPSTPIAGLIALLALLNGAPAVAAAEIRILAATPLERGITEIAAQFQKETGTAVKVQIANSGELNRILQTANGDTLDLLLAPSTIVDPFIKDGKAQGEKSLAGRVGIGVVIRKGAPVPDVATSDALKKAVLAADGVVYNTAGSGQAVQRMFDQMGIGGQVAPKAARPNNAAGTMDRILTGKGTEIGFGLLSEVKPYEEKGIQLVGRLPQDVQSYTNYDAAIVAGSKSADAVKAFLKFLATPAARGKLAATGVD